MARFAAKLLFAWDPEPDGIRRRRRLCEERIVTFEARSTRAALARAEAWGRRSTFEHRYTRAVARFQFLGVLDLMELGLECEPGEVWYELRRRVRPRERRSHLVPPKRTLQAFKDERVDITLKRLAAKGAV
jgi:hypothetical protein